MPPYFQDREQEAESIVRFMQEPSPRLLLLQGHGGIGKTALLMRVLWKHQVNPPPAGPAFADGMVYLTVGGAAQLTWPGLYGAACNLLPAQTADDLRSLYRQKGVPPEAKNATLVRALSGKRLLFVLDGVDAVLNPETANFTEPELQQALETILVAPESETRILLTSRTAPSFLHEPAPGSQQTLFLGPLDKENSIAMLRSLDAAGNAGIKNAPPELLAEVYEVTRGSPRAMEALHALLLTDSTIALPRLLSELRTRLSGNPAEALAA